MINGLLKFGMFANGDIPCAVLGHMPFTKVKKASGNCEVASAMYFKVEFKQRCNGVMPQSVYVAYEEIAKKYPRLLLDYFNQHSVLIDTKLEEKPPKTKKGQQK